MEPIKVDFSKQGNNVAKETVIPPDKAGLKIVISIIVALVAGVIGYYFYLPALNFKSYDLYIFIGGVLAAFVVCNALLSKVLSRPEYVPYIRKTAIPPIIIAIVLAAVAAVGYVVSAPLFRAKSYSKIISITETDESEGKVSKITNINNISDFNKIALIDDIAAERLADKALGELATYGLESQFDVLNTLSTQINYKGSPYRVFPLEYDDIFKWLKQTSNGFPGYITVNMNTQETDFVKTETGIRYSMAEHFGKHVKRVVRFEYPTYILGKISFEIDEQGNPFWLCQHIDKKVGLFGGDDVIGVIVVNAYTGECAEYDYAEFTSGKSSEGTDIEWIDSVYDGNLLVKQYDYNYKYKNGFINFYIGQENVKLTTAGYSYLTDGNDVYLYTGVTSANGDQSILGFALVNQRTKEAFFYSVSGATEIAAKSSAEGIVSDKGWTATFPLLVNLKTANGDYEPTYFMALKDASDVIKSYSMVNVAQYSDAVRSPSDDNPDLKACLAAYKNKLAQRNNPISISIDMTGQLNTENPDAPAAPETETNTVAGTIASIKSVIISGDTYYYITLDGGDAIYLVKATLDNNAALLSNGDEVTFTFTEGEKVNTVTAIE